MKYEIKGEPTPVVICELSAGESMITEKGSMVWMSPNMEMQTSAGGLGKAFGRMFSGESIFQNIYTAQGGPGTIAFASSFPGAIRAVETTPDRPIVSRNLPFGGHRWGGALRLFSKEVRGRLFRRRRLYYAETFWPRNRLFGDRRLWCGIRSGGRTATDCRYRKSRCYGHQLFH